MGKVVETKPKKKKGRPSLIDIQKRNIKEEQDRNNNNPHNPYSNPNFKNPIIPNPNPNPNRRFTRRNPIPDGISPELDRIDGGDDEEDNDDLNANRKEKKLKLFLRLPSHQQQRLSVNSTSLNSGSYESDSNAENEIDETPLKKRKINVVRDGSGHGDDEKGENLNSASRARGTLPDSLLESSPATPLPDKKLLVFILDRLQKKDTYGVFSEPVDPKELPDYHDVIKHPMDFGTVRKKLEGGAYANLEQFEKDVFLICSNAMRYNAPDTIYFRQARSIQELAKKDFENSRQESEDNEPQPKVVRRGRPPTKHLKKPLGRPPFDRAGSEFSVDATLVTGGDNAIWYNSYDLRKGPLSDKSVLTDASGRTFRGSHNSEVYSSWLAKHKSEWNDEFPGSMLKGMSMKNGQKQFVLDENRRNTYKQSHPSVSWHEPSVFTTFSGEKQQLMAVGIHSDYGYARSLARFAAYLGPVAWKFASMKIERALPAGVKFGPGWVGENEAPPPQPPPPLLSSPSPQVSSQQPHSLPNISPITATPLLVEPRGDESLKKQGPLNNSSGSDLPSRHLPPSTADPSTSTVVANRPPEPTTTKGLEAIKDSNNESKYSLLNSAAASIRHRPPLQIHQNAVTHLTVNGFSGGFGFNHSSQMGKFVRPASQVGSLGPEASMPNRMLDMASKSNHNFVQQMPANSLDSEDPMLANSSTINSGRSLPDTSHEAQATPKLGLRPNPSWRGYSLHQKPDSVLPPDLNVRFQSPGSPSSSVRVDSPQPDLALQL